MRKNSEWFLPVRYFTLSVLSLNKISPMARMIIAIFCVLLPALSFSQQRIAAAPAYLQLTGIMDDGKEVNAGSRELAIMYEPGIARGELRLGTLSSTDERINELLVAVKEKILYITITIPEGKFAFGDSMNEKFTSFGTISIDDHDSEFSVEFDVSNKKDGRDNAFIIIGQGRLSLQENFNLPESYDISDSFGFIFNQNLTVFTP